MATTAQLIPRIYYHTVGDTLTPYPFRLQREIDGRYQPADLTNLTARLRLVTDAGAVIVDDVLATITDPLNGEGHYDFTDPDVAAPGTYYAWIIVTDPGTGRVDTYPGRGRQNLIIMTQAN